LAALPNSGWTGGLTLRDITRGLRSANDGTLTGGTAWSGQKPVGSYGSLSFDGSDDYVTGALSFSSQADYSVSARVYFVTGDGSGFGMIWGPGGYGFDLRVQTSNGHIDYENLQSTSNITNRWCIVTTTQIGSARKLYVDGVQENSNASGAALTTSVYYIGKRFDNALLFAGKIDAVRVWNRGLSANEVSSLYLEDVGGNPTRWAWVRPWSFGVAVAAADDDLSIRIATARSNRTIKRRRDFCNLY